MFLQRTVPLIIVFVVGFLTLLSWFIPHEPFNHFEIHSTQWYDIIASFAVILGALNLLKLQGQRVVRRGRNWQYSLVAILGFFFTLAAGFLWRGGHHVVMEATGPNTTEVAGLIAESMEVPAGAAATAVQEVTVGGERQVSAHAYTRGAAERQAARFRAAGATVRVEQVPLGGHLQQAGTPFSWMFNNIFTPLTATMFALLAFYVASASYRAFRIRNLEATVLLLAGIILMLGRVPIGNNLLLPAEWLPSWLKFLNFPILQEWIYNFPNIAGARAVMVGIALGMVGTSLRVILGIEKSFMGEK